MGIAAFVWQSLSPTLPLPPPVQPRRLSPQWWDDNSSILGGRDFVEGGTWLACNKDGKVAFFTNVRERKRLDKHKNRGQLPGKTSPIEFAEEVVEEADQYNGFNLILDDLHSKTMLYVTNRPKNKRFITEVSPGIHVLTDDAMLDSPWPKLRTKWHVNLLSQRLGNSFKEMLNKYGEDEVSLKKMAEQLMTYISVSTTGK